MATSQIIEAERQLGIGRAQLVRRSWDAPIDILATVPVHYLELATLPLSSRARACFPDDWGANRFEPIGSLFLLPARHTVHTVSDCRQQSSVVCMLDPQKVSDWLERDLQWTNGRLRSTLDITSGQVRRLLQRIGEELRNPGFASETLVELLVAQAAVELSRHLFAIEERKRSGGLPARCLRAIDERVEQPAPPSLAELAALCGVSVRHLTRAFRASRGRSIGDYLADRRIARARQLLASGMHVKSVAFEVGFSAPSNFAAAFLRATGETPRQYRDRLLRSSVTAQVH
jgi:AraC family transcriptional regulator